MFNFQTILYLLNLIDSTIQLQYDKGSLTIIFCITSGVLSLYCFSKWFFALPNKFINNPSVRYTTQGNFSLVKLNELLILFESSSHVHSVTHKIEQFVSKHTHTHHCLDVRFSCERGKRGQGAAPSSRTIPYLSVFWFMSISWRPPFVSGTTHVHYLYLVLHTQWVRSPALPGCRMDGVAPDDAITRLIP